MKSEAGKRKKNNPRRLSAEGAAYFLFFAGGRAILATALAGLLLRLHRRRLIAQLHLGSWSEKLNVVDGVHARR